jgi:uncharacterized protein YcfJ
MTESTPNQTMKKIQLTIVSGLCAFALTNCAEPSGPNTQRGAVAGGLLGAVVGGVIGHQSGRGLEGAAIGGAAGAGAGSLYGNAQDQEQRRRYNNGY